MLSLEQVKLLETKVVNTIEYVQRVTGENAALRKKLEGNQKRIDELEVMVTRFKEDQGRIEDGILSALDRLNQFEDAIEKSLAARTKEAKPAAPAVKKTNSPPNNKLAAEKLMSNDVASNTAEPDAGEKAENGELDIF